MGGGTIVEGVAGNQMPGTPEKQRAAGRRTLLGALLAAPLLVVAGGARRWLKATPDREVLSLLGPVRAGTTVGAWTVAAVYSLRFGAIPLLLTSGPSRIQVDLLRRDPVGPNGVADAGPVTICLANGGNGRSPTPEDHALLGRALAAMLEPAAQRAAVPPSLLTIRDRAARFPGGVVFSV
jgi:hypothetical protein